LQKILSSFDVSSFYHPKRYSFTVRHPESIFAAKEPKEEIHPIIRPSTEVYEELYQFTKVTISLSGRVFLSAILLAYGMRENYLPLIIAGLLFLPHHHHMLGVGLGFCLMEWRFLKQPSEGNLSAQSKGLWKRLNYHVVLTVMMSFKISTYPFILTGFSKTKSAPTAFRASATVSLASELNKVLSRCYQTPFLFSML
jgi:hypothetical protein